MTRALLTFFGALFILAVIGAGGVFYVFYSYGRDLPNYQMLADYQPPVMTRIHAGDGQLIMEYAKEKRVFVPMKAIPRRIIHAVLSAEDKNFYSHIGVDFFSVVRAVVTNVRNLGSDRRPVGASTITQQVAKNFLLTSEVSLDRKVKEAIIAFRMERAFTKDRILELYMNEIYLGAGSYGFAAAALNYFNKPLDGLTIAEAALLAALPKAPSNYNPIRRPDAAKVRRDWVIKEMMENGYITGDEAGLAAEEPITLMRRSQTEFVRHGASFSEEVRRELAERFGENTLYTGGLSVRTTLDPKLQEIATQALRGGLEAYDRRHGWRGAVATLDLGAVGSGWAAALAKITPPGGIGTWRLALVLRVTDTEATLGFADGTGGRIPFGELRWARPWIKGQRYGYRPKRVPDVINPGDVVLVDGVSANAKGKAYPAGTYGLRQVPDINGAIVALDPHTGRVLAMAGGYDFDKSQFNRATQAMRQPGSAFKPIVYLSALDSGYTPSTLILDAPFVIDQGPGLPKWRPANYTKKFYGPSTMRLGIEKSRNLMTVRLAQTVGMEKIVAYAKAFGITDDMPAQLAMSLGAGETTLLKLTTAYAMLVNNGKKITPTLIDRIQDRQGATILRHDERPCPDCQVTFWTSQSVPVMPDDREQVTDPASAYQMVAMLQGVVERGTGRGLRRIGKPLAGKTGTTNKSQDAWFVGFTPDLAVGVYTGFDEPKPLGPQEQGASVALPIFRDFMAGALKDKSATPFRIPPGIRLVRVDAQSGLPARPGQKKVILEAFKPGTVPTGVAKVLEGLDGASGGAPAPARGTGGLY